MSDKKQGVRMAPPPKFMFGVCMIITLILWFLPTILKWFLGRVKWLIIWHKTRRSVERDYKFYDSPRVIYRKITQATWPYSKDNMERLGLRDLAFMCLMYGSTCRSSELCRYDKRNPEGALLFSKHSVDKSQFIIEDDLLKFREVIILKRREPVLDEKRIHCLCGRKTAIQDHRRSKQIPHPKRDNFPTRRIIQYLHQPNNRIPRYPRR